MRLELHTHMDSPLVRPALGLPRLQSKFARWVEAVCVRRVLTTIPISFTQLLRILLNPNPAACIFILHTV
jgi:hypothetical protein